jgi:aryl-alcohol dehydrogenase-like predicted oxidoreductase
MSGDEFAESLRFSLEHPGTSSIIIGTINPQHLQQNVDAVNVLQ